jgi:uncharacterized protein (TIGR03435 family)
MRSAFHILINALTAAASFAAADLQSFDVASIKPNRSVSRAGSTSRSGNRVTFDNVSLRETIEFAYGIPPGRGDELVGPAWLDTEKFDIVATCPPETARERVLEMFRTLLTERFGLRTHRENRTVTGYALVAGKRGPSLRPAAKPAEENLTFGEGRLTASGMSMSSFAARLSGPIFNLGRPVMDMTGISGAYDFILRWAPDVATTTAEATPSIFTAIEEELGLKLERRELSVDVVVIDHVERVPSGN